jgi:hypothetical protein
MKRLLLNGAFLGGKVAAQAMVQAISRVAKSPCQSPSESSTRQNVLFSVHSSMV